MPLFQVMASVTGMAAMDVSTGLMTPTSPGAHAPNLPCFTGAQEVNKDSFVI